MFNIPAEMTARWARSAEPKASRDDVARIEAAVGAALPVPYVEFITDYGFVVFEMEPGIRRHFDYTVDVNGASEIREGNIAFLHEPERLLLAYEYSTTSEEDGGSPLFPPNFVPVGNDAGQGQILLESGDHAGRVWYWPERNDAWGTGDNTVLGFVANDFYEFINKLR